MGGIIGDGFDVDAVAVNSVPDPGTLLLLGTGILGLVGASRKKLHKKFIFITAKRKFRLQTARSPKRPGSSILEPIKNSTPDRTRLFALSPT